MFYLSDMEIIHPETRSTVINPGTLLSGVELRALMDKYGFDELRAYEIDADNRDIAEILASTVVLTVKSVNA